MTGAACGNCKHFETTGEKTGTCKKMPGLLTIYSHCLEWEKRKNNE